MSAAAEEEAEAAPPLPDEAKAVEGAASRGAGEAEGAAAPWPEARPAISACDPAEGAGADDRDDSEESK